MGISQPSKPGLGFAVASATITPPTTPTTVGAGVTRDLLLGTVLDPTGIVTRTATTFYVTKAGLYSVVCVVQRVTTLTAGHGWAAILTTPQGEIVIPGGTTPTTTHATISWTGYLAPHAEGAGYIAADVVNHDIVARKFTFFTYTIRRIAV